MNYRAHGDHKLYFHGNIVIAELHGSWNEQAAQRYGAEIRQRIDQLGGRPWCRVVDLSHYELHTPGVLTLGKGFARWTAENGCLFHSYIFSNSLQRYTVKQMFTELAQPYGEASNLEEAMSQCHAALNRCQQALLSQ